MKAGRIGIAAAVPLLGAAFVATPAQAQTLQDDYWFQVSGYWANVDTDVSVSQVDNPTVGTEIDLEDDLGFDDSEFLPAFLAGARVGGCFSIGAEYYALNRDSSFDLAREIVIEDVTYPVAGTVTSSFDTDIYRLTVGWAFARGPNYELGGAIGVHATNLDISIEGQGSVNGAPVSAQQRRQDFLAPLPTIGLFGNYEVMPGLTIGARVDYLSLSVGDYDGRLLNTQISASYRFTRNFGVGILYRYVDYQVDVEKEFYTGRFAYEFAGPALFLEVGF
jgi:hypothetical protein